jgi:hypothetical protein
MIEIQLTQGKVALIDDEDYPLVCQFKWYAKKNHCTMYACTGERNTYMHALIAGKYCDHRNGNGLDNRRCNLRFATFAQNSQNRSGFLNRTSKYKGVSFDTARNKWRVEIKANGQDTWIGRYSTEQEAALAYDKAALYYHGDFAWINSAHFEELQ